MPDKPPAQEGESPPYAPGADSTGGAAARPTESASSSPSDAATPTSDRSTPPDQSRQLPPDRRASADGWRYIFSSLSNRNFRFLWLGTVLFMGSMQMQMMAVGYLTYDLTRSAVLLGVVQSGFAPAMLVLSLYGGAIADRIDRKKIIVVSQLWEACVYLFIAVTIAIGMITWFHLFAMIVFDGIMFSFMGPARQAIIPQLVGKDQVTNALAISAAATSTMTLTAPAVGGLLYAWLGPEGVFFTTAVMAVIAAMLTRFIPSVKPKATARKAILSDIKDGLIYMRQSRLVMVLLVMGAATALFAMPFKHFLPVLMVEIYDRGPESMGLLLSIMGLGSLIGALFIASLGKWRRGLILIMGTFITGIGLSLIAALPFYYVAAGLMVLIGLGDSARRTLYHALLIEHTDDEYRGRVMSVWMLNFSLMPLGVLPAGFVADWAGGQAAVAMFAVAVLATGVIVLATQAQLRRLE